MLNNCYSEFCGFPFCKLCALKSKPYPRNNPEFKRRGQICKICDRKFHVREFIKGQKQDIQAQALVIQSLQSQITLKDEECADLDSEH